MPCPPPPLRRARIDGKNLILAVGKSHDVIMPIPDGVKVVVEDNIRLVVSGISIGFHD